MVEAGQGSGGVIKDTAEAVKGIVEAVPIYQDALQPAAKEIGTALETVGKAVNVCLAPIKGLVWGYEQIEEFLKTRLTNKLRDVPPERIQTPETHIAGPTMMALRFVGAQDELREMYANLLATAMDRQTARNAHPAFVEIVRQLSPDEARIVALFVGRRGFPVVTVQAAVRGGIGRRDILKNFAMVADDAGCQYPELYGQSVPSRFGGCSVWRFL